MASRGIVTLELVVDFCRGSERLLEEVGPYERGRTVHLVEILDFFRNVEIWCVIVEFLPAEFLAENRGEFFQGERLAGTRVEKGSRLVLHVCPDIVPLCRNLIFSEINLVRDFLFHNLKVLFVNIRLFLNVQSKNKGSRRSCGRNLYVSLCIQNGADLLRLIEL